MPVEALITFLDSKFSRSPQLRHETCFLQEILNATEDIFNSLTPILLNCALQLCPMCVAEEIQKARLEKREEDLKEKAKEYMYVQ